MFWEIYQVVWKTGEWELGRSQDISLGRAPGRAPFLCVVIPACGTESLPLWYCPAPAPSLTKQVFSCCRDLAPELQDSTLPTALPLCPSSSFLLLLIVLPHLFAPQYRRKTPMSPTPCTNFPLCEILKVVSIFCLPPDLFTKVNELVQANDDNG